MFKIMLYRLMSFFGLVEINYCSKCKKWKVRSEFNKDNRSSIGVHYYCKKCRSEYRRKNQHKINEYYKKWCEKNPEALKRYKENKKDNERNRYTRIFLGWRVK